MTVQKDDIYEFGFGRSDQVTKNDNLVDEAVFSFLYGHIIYLFNIFLIKVKLDIKSIFCYKK